MGLQILPVGKQEFHDGVDWYSLASENWVKNNFNIILPCILGTTANLTATYSNETNGVGATLTNSGTQAALALDGVSVSLGNRILVKNQTTLSQNGVYTVTNIGSESTNWVLTRAADFDSPSQMITGTILSIGAGTVGSNASTIWLLAATVTAVGTSPLSFVNPYSTLISSVQGTTNQITVVTASGIATIGLATNPVIPGTASVTIPTGTTAQRPSTPTAGMVRLNTSL
jgi:hypothetical protein